MTRQSHHHTVVVALNIGGKAGREYLAGIFRYLNAGHSWNLRILHHSDELTIPVIQRELENGADAFLVGFAKDSEALRYLLKQPRPIVFLDYPGLRVNSKRRDVIFVRSDDEALGTIAAHYLHHCGNFRSYAFVPDGANPCWSILREQGFCHFLRKKGIAASVFRRKDNEADELEDWVRQLPKPAAVFAASDSNAVDVSAACRRTRVAIPDQLILVGTDNDELLCTSVTPAISSFVPDHEGIGFRSAAEIDALLSGIRPRDKEIHVAPGLSPVERASTAHGTPSGFLIKSALAFINDNIAKGIGVADVISHLGVSRRLAYLRFEEQLHKPIHQVLVEARLGLATKLLRKTTLTVESIALQSGFPSAAALTRALKANRKMTPAAFRKTSHS